SWHSRAKRRLDAVASPQAGNLVLDLLRQSIVGLDHVAPNHVSAHVRRCHVPQHTAHRRLLAPGCVTVPGILVVIVLRLPSSIDLHKSGVTRAPACTRVVLTLTK